MKEGILLERTRPISVFVLFGEAPVFIICKAKFGLRRAFHFKLHYLSANKLKVHLIFAFGYISKS